MSSKVFTFFIVIVIVINYDFETFSSKMTIHLPQLLKKIAFEFFLSF